MGRDVDDVGADASWDREARDETQIERLDRNWGDLLQELRVVQTGSAPQWWSVADLRVYG